MHTAHDCKEELRAAGSRATPGRLALLRVLERERTSSTVPQLAKKLPRLNVVTLYRALEVLVSAGLIRKGVKNRVTYFEYAGKPHHHHLICTDCGYSQACRACA